MSAGSFAESLEGDGSRILSMGCAGAAVGALCDV